MVKRREQEGSDSCVGVGARKVVGDRKRRQNEGGRVS